MSLLEILCVLVSGVVCLYFYFKRNHKHWVKRGIPGPKAAFIVGNLPSIFTQKRSPVYDMEEIYYKWKKEANLAGFFNMMQPQILLLKPELVKMVTVKNFQNFHDNDFADMFNKDSDPVFTKTIFMLKGAEWKERRAELAPAFTDNRVQQFVCFKCPSIDILPLCLFQMKSMFLLIEEISKRLVQHLDKVVQSSGSPVVLEARTLVTKFSVDVVGNCIFRVDGGAFKDDNSEMMKIGEELMNPSGSFLISFLLIQLFPVLKGILRPRLIKSVVVEYLKKLIREVTQKRQENPTDGKDFMSFMEHLQINKGTPPAQILGHVFTFFIDGYEMSSNVLAHTLYQLAKNPEVQDKLRDELQSLDSLESLATPNSNQCEYLHRVLLESLRINAPLPYLTKRCTKGCSLPLRDDEEVFIETNTPVVIPIYIIQRDAEHFPNPEAFDPDRFVDGNAKKFQNAGIFMPFGDGPRICMGMKFAMLQVKIAVAVIIKNYSLKVDPKTRDPFCLNPKLFTSTPEGGYWLQFTPLESN
ncbi:probable cytochrome P450 28a5 [Phlebotomus argentipes]|uniref:probable cytochrome P450 28a5 n=1 Tax=Phlebotomus argentipes TaxID=94469 RepID=UPI0028932E2D|nr:probable cytochrome P450 28a5 [Phlebotomus argentipes]